MTDAAPLCPDCVEAADEIARILHPILRGKDFAEILCAFGLLVSHHATHTHEADLDEMLDLIRIAAKQHFAASPKGKLQ